jgi:hypothetical protein
MLGPVRYAAKVAEGFRPPQPKKISQELWELISYCWHQDPTERPCMSQVGQHAGGKGGHRCGHMLLVAPHVRTSG